MKVNLIKIPELTSNLRSADSNKTSETIIRQIMDYLKSGCYDIKKLYNRQTDTLLIEFTTDKVTYFLCFMPRPNYTYKYDISADFYPNYINIYCLDAKILKLMKSLNLNNNEEFITKELYMIDLSDIKLITE